MNRHDEAGNISMLMVLMLLLLGVMMLTGLSSHLMAQRQWGATEVRSIVRYAGAQSALAWGEGQAWSPAKGWQCQTESLSALKACLYQTGSEDVLLAGASVENSPSEQLVHWRWGRLEKGKFVASSHGWLDYCPLSDKTDCNLTS